MFPYLSIIVTSRNDSHDRSLLYRMQTFISTLLSQLHGVDIDVELIIVEWNPIAGRLPLIKALSFKNKPDNCAIRIITVPKTIHRTMKNAQKLGLFQFVAKNVGIKRAKGTYILSTNIDILFSSGLIKHISDRKLNENEVVRVVRFDVPQSLPGYLSTDELLDYCWIHRTRAFWPWGTDELHSQDIKLLSNFLASLKLKLHRDAYTNACGDFTLMAAKHWHTLRGYPEFPLHGFKLDSLFIHAAISYGLSQRILPVSMCVYHIDHPLSWTSEKRKGLLVYFGKKGIPTIDPVLYNNYVTKMRKEKKPIRFNDDNWGLVNEILHEVVFE